MSPIRPINPLDSRQQLAVSIQRTLRHEMPATPPTQELRASIDAALLADSRENERTLSVFRVGALAALLIAYGAALMFRGSAVSVDTSGAIVRIPQGAALATLVAALLLAWRLRTGWYRTWLRYVAPMLDALIIVTVAVLYATLVGSDLGATAPAIAAGMGALLAASGALRLTRTSAQLSSALGAAAVLATSVLLELTPIAAIALLVPVATGSAFAFVATDIIRRAVTNQIGRTTMNRLYSEAQQVIDARAEVLRVVAHDLRNPLNTISMGTSALLDDAPPVQRAQLQIVKRAAARMNRLIQDLLDVSIIEAGRLTMQPVSFDLGAIVTEAAETLGPLAREKRIAFETKVPEALPNVRGDPARVLQVFSNLVGNAIKFTPAGGTISLAVTPREDVVRCDVIDTGAGIPPEQLKNIFGRFWQATRGDRRGIGLGLSIAKGIVDAHGQQLTVMSTVGEGSIFSFTLPVA